MKKRFFSLMLIAASFSATAQTLIPRAGITIASNSISPSPENFGVSDGQIKSQTGFTAGLGFALPLTTMLSVQTELNFIQKGFIHDYSSSIDSEKQNQKLKYSYLELPVMIRYALGPDIARIHLVAGPSVGIGLGGTYKYRYSVFYTEDETDVLYEESSDGKVKFEKEPDRYLGPDIYLEKRMDVGLQVGAGVTLFNKIMVDIRYGVGLTNITEKDVTGNTQNRVLQFTVGVPIKLF